MILIRKNGPSNGASALREALRGAGRQVLFSTRSIFHTPRRLIVNWGDMEDAAAHPTSLVLNTRASRRVAANKITAFAALAAADVSIPKHFTTLDSATAWRNAQPSNRRQIMLARHTVNGSGGEGIQVVRQGEPLPAGAPLYTEYVRKLAEYRVHVMKGEAIAVQQKRAVRGHDHTEDQLLIRNHGNGWVFSVENVDSYAEQAKELAVKATAALGLDFAAIDLIRRSSGELMVLEANTKPGLESPTVLAAYVNKLSQLEDSL